ncbi:DNA methyltransferase [Vibrio phage K459]
MKYMGSKARHAKEILKVIASYRKEGQAWVEPFVGGANMIDKVEAPLRIGGDFNEYVIALYHALQSGEKLPEGIDQRYYEIVKSNKEQFPKWVVGLIGFCFTFGAKWFGGYVGDGGSRDRVGESYRNAEKTRNQVEGCVMIHSSYDDLPFPDESLIYCDSPYEGTTKYRDAFDHDKFWQWCRDMSDEGHTLFVSEYNAPADFACVWEKQVNTTIATSKKATEKLFVYIPQLLRDGVRKP